MPLLSTRSILKVIITSLRVDEVSVTQVDSLINCVKFTLWHRSCKATASRECGFSISQFSSDDDIFPECKRLRILVHKVINKTGHRTIFGPISYTENDGS